VDGEESAGWSQPASVRPSETVLLFGRFGSGYPRDMMRHALWEGVVAGASGAAVMTLSEKLEQRVTGRPNSYVPARVLGRLARLSDATGRESLMLNWAMHFGQAAALGVVRSVMSESGLRGPVASAKFAVIRLTTDQILENATGVGAPPQTWPRSELAIDLLHKTVYACVTGAVADALASRRGPGPGQQHAAIAPGRHSGVGPVPPSAATLGG
jgi:hypothetical protein